MGKPKQYWSARYFSKETNSLELIENRSTLTKNCVQPDAECCFPQHMSIHSIDTSNTSFEKLIPVRPQPIYNIGRNLNISDLEVTSVPFTLPNICSREEPINKRGATRLDTTISVPLATGDPGNHPNRFGSPQYVRNHLSNIEITRIHAPEPNSVNGVSIVSAPQKLRYNTYCLQNLADQHIDNFAINDEPRLLKINQYTPECISTPQYASISTSVIGVPTVSAPEKLRCNTISKQEHTVQHSESSTANGKSDFEGISAKSKSIKKGNSALSRGKRGKPIIPDDVKDMFNSAGIDETIASEVIVHSTIDAFRENVSKIADKLELKERLKEVRRKGKNRNAAKKSRLNMLERMRILRERKKELTDKLAKIKGTVQKIHVLREKSKRYEQRYLQQQIYYHEKRLQHNRVDIRQSPQSSTIHYIPTQYNVKNKDTFLERNPCMLC